MTGRISEDFVEAVRAAPVLSHPFPHMRLSRVFGEGDYREILRLLPPTEHYLELRHKDARLPDGTYARLRFPLIGERLRKLDRERRRYWEAMSEALRDPDVAKAFAARFAEMDCESPPQTGSILRISLVRDRPGYCIRPHQDVPSKLLTAQIYLPRDEKGADLGTSFYRREESGALEVDVRVPFLPNSGYAFPVTSDSWHGVDTVPPGATPRDSLMLVWYVDGAWKKLGAASRAVLRWLRS